MEAIFCYCEGMLPIVPGQCEFLSSTADLSCFVMPPVSLLPFEYSLLDFGGGRKLERFGPVILDRYSPSAEGCPIQSPHLWHEATARYVRRNETQGEWQERAPLPARWEIAAGPLRFRLKTTAFGHLGLFPEQFANWQWLQQACAAAERPLRILNLFAYTGGATLACVSAGAEVTHVDAAANVVKWARANAALSSMAEAPIRWIAEDARKFVKREHKRGNHYDGVILDPPTYGHGSKGEVWRIGRHLPLLMGHLSQLLADVPRLVLLTCHSPGYEAAALKNLVQETFPQLAPSRIEAGPLQIADRQQRQLPSGHFARFHNPD